MKPVVEASPLDEIDDLFELTLMIQFQKFKSRWPKASTAQLMRRIDEWLLHAEPLDPREFQRVSWQRRLRESAKSSLPASTPSKRKERGTASSAASRGRSSLKRGAPRTSISP